MIIGGEVGEQRRKAIMERTDNYYNYYQKFKKINMNVKLLIQIIETV